LAPQQSNPPQAVVQPNGQRVFPASMDTSGLPPAANQAPAAPRGAVQTASWNEPVANTDAGKSRVPLELKVSPKSKSQVDKPTSQWSAILSMFFSLTIVMCLFLFVVWLFRKAQPNSFVKLPKDVVQILGRSAMAPRQQVYVVRFGNKMLLVSHQPGQTQTLGEITDPLEVERLAGLCEANQPTSISHSFRDVMAHVVSGKPDEDRPRGDRRTRMHRT
jgi:flagellar biogenesis protein FliO